MADTGGILLALNPVKAVLIERAGVRFAAEQALGIAKLQILDAEPDSWFEQALGTAPPAALREVAPGPVTIAWLAPGEWLVMGEAADVDLVRARCAEAAGSVGLMRDMTHGYAAFELSGSAARSMLAAHCPLDLDDAAMPIGAAKRSTFASTRFFISRRADRDGQPCFRLIFDQTLAGYVERLLGATTSGANM